jgi:hypothetical protein
MQYILGLFVAIATASTLAAPVDPPPLPLPQVPRGPEYQDPPFGNGRRLHPYGRGDLCVTVQNGYAGEGTNVAM